MVIEAGRIAGLDTAENLQRVDGYYRVAMDLAGTGTAHADPCAPTRASHHRGR
jgi:hypothetical protein